jgi:hypothetical protein
LIASLAFTQGILVAKSHSTPAGKGITQLLLAKESLNSCWQRNHSTPAGKGITLSVVFFANANCEKRKTVIYLCFFEVMRAQQTDKNLVRKQL